MEIDLETKLNTLVEISKMRLAKILDKIAGPKDITIEPNLIRPLERICGVKWLRSYEIDKIFKFETISPVHTKKNHLYLISANLLLFKRVLDQIQECLNKNSGVQYHIIITPRILITFETLLEELGLYDIVKLYWFPWDFIHLDTDILSLEIPYMFSEIYVNGDLSLLPCFGYSLRTLFCVTGKPKITINLGNLSSNVLRHLEIYTDNLGYPPKEESDFDVFLVMDRSVDYISTLLTSTTYTALLSEVYKVKCGVVERKETEQLTTTSSDASTSSDNQPTQKPSFLFSMDSVNDPVYSDIKNRHISEVSEILRNEARLLKSESEAPKEMGLSEIKSYIQTKLQKVTAKSKFLSCHLEACEKIINSLGDKFETLKNIDQFCIENINKSSNIRNIEDMILMDNEFSSLKLICLISLTQKLNADELHNLKLQYLQAVGYKYLYMFDNLKNCGLILEPTKSKILALNLSLPTASNKKDFYIISNKLKLIPPKPEQINIRAPTCPSYIFGGCYIPLIAQLIIQLVQAQNLNDIKSKLDLLNGTITTENLQKPFPLARRKIFLCMIGGLTYAEVAALNLVEKLCNCKIIMASNCMMSGNDFMEANK